MRAYVRPLPVRARDAATVYVGKLPAHKQDALVSHIQYADSFPLKVRERKEGMVGEHKLFSPGPA